ncbi:DUF4136 domain-containing protein [Vaginella massiliensis]|uniref:DUF4136 domain-containing protein n=1 Tax=Vaginella massiliensis TaxID=1816680 RepID=UPI00083894D1|nr:DUF4136 domain-containing protein [Vaginella massiliensis]
MKKISLLVLVGLSLLACSTQNVQVDYDRAVNFSNYKTYQINSENSTLNDLDKQRLLATLGRELSAKGLNLADDAQLMIEITPKEYLSENRSTAVGVGLGGGNYGFGGGVSVGIPINQKKLNQEFVVQMKDGQILVWEGILTIQMPVNASPEMRESAINKGVAKLLKNYPPKQ